ncbi:MAG: patatin-like phospholipase family protein [Hyphomicrobiaceae bacterium]
MSVPVTRRWAGIAVIAVAALVIGGCAAQLVRTPVPANLVDQAAIADAPDVRYWGDALPKNIRQAIALSDRQSRRKRPHLFRNGRRKAVKFLAISGGGSHGAFGAGLLVGWTAAGTRPEFDLVTGVSTGALSAPFAFLGPKYDRQLKEIYTRYGTEQLIQKQVIAGLLGGAAIADNSKLASVIASYVDRDFLRVVAREHRRGRRLLISTTNIDAERPVVWDMGRISQRDSKRSLALFRKILLASAAVPAVFPPVVINVRADGRNLQELHVDGGTTGQVFFLPPQLLVRNIVPKHRRRRPVTAELYVVMNGSLSPKFQTVEARTTAIASRSLWTIMKQQAIGDLYKLYVEARNNRIKYFQASIPDSFTMTSKEPFDLKYMRALFQHGFDLGKRGYRWARLPPGLNADVAAIR